MKAFKLTLGIILIMMIAVITFYTSNLLFSVVSNYEAITPVAIAFIPLAFIVAIFITLLIGAYRLKIRKIGDLYFFRHYSILLIILGTLGAASAIVVGTVVYHTFIGPYIFAAYPLFTLIINVLFIALGIYGTVVTVKKIRSEKPERLIKTNVAYGFKTAAVSLLLVYALNRLGAFVLIPFYWSSYDSIYVLPYLIQLLVPAVIVVNYCLFENCGDNRKIPVISSAICFGYTIFTLIYMIAMSKGTYPLMINALTPVQHFERLVRYPIDLAVMYGVCVLISGLSLLNHLVRVIKLKKKLG